jgi:hypothetical protein
LENQIEIQKTRFFILHHQLGHLYQRLNRKDYCLAYQTGGDHINAFVIKQVKKKIEKK